MSVRKETRDRCLFRRQADMAQEPLRLRDLLCRAAELEQNPRRPLPPREGHRGQSKAAVRRWMRLNADQYETATALVEGCNAALALPQAWLDDDGHWVWEIAAREVPE